MGWAGDNGWTLQDIVAENCSNSGAGLNQAGLGLKLVLYWWHWEGIKQGGKDERVMPSVLELLLLLAKASCNPGVNPEVLQLKGIKDNGQGAFRDGTEALGP